MIEYDGELPTPPPEDASLFHCAICNKLDCTPLDLHGIRLCFDCYTKAMRAASGLFVSGNTALSADTVVEYLIDKMVETDTTGLLFGPSGSGKSFVKLDQALCIATGTPWNGHAVKKGLVIYLAGEGLVGLKRRIKAWCKHHGINDLSCFYLSTRTITFDSEALSQITRAAKQLEVQTGHDVVLIVIDTLARHMEGNENSTQDMNRFINVADSIRAEFPGSASVIVHHTGNSEEASHRARGASSLKAAMDFEISCNKGLLTYTKMKDGEPPTPIPFKLCPVQIGTDPKGQPVTSCIVEYDERAERHQQNKLSNYEQQAMQALLTACITENICINNQFYTLVQTWREEFYRLRRIEEPDAKAGTLRNSFHRVTGSGPHGGGLKEKGIIAITEQGAIPLRIVDQEKIALSISGNVTRHNSVTTASHETATGAPSQASHPLYNKGDDVTPVCDPMDTPETEYFKDPFDMPELPL